MHPRSDNKRRGFGNVDVGSGRLDVSNAVPLGRRRCGRFGPRALHWFDSMGEQPPEVLSLRSAT
jgi:hypothetical protein